MNFEKQVRCILTEELTAARIRNPSFSMRAFARKAGVAQSVISEVLRGKRSLTKKTAQRILTGLSRDPAEIQRVLEGADQVSDPQNSYNLLEMDEFYLMAEWYHYAILSLAETEDFKGAPLWISKRLGISAKVASRALERLLRLNLLKKTGRRILATGQYYSAVSPTPSIALKAANRENLQLAEAAIEAVTLEMRDFTAMTLCFDPDRMREARRLIQEFRRSFDQKMESGRKREVYKLCIQLFPLSKAGK